MTNRYPTPDEMLEAARRRGDRHMELEIGGDEEAARDLARHWPSMGYNATAKVMYSTETMDGEDQAWNDRWGVSVRL
jgi:hypothetical protein